MIEKIKNFAWRIAQSFMGAGMNSFRAQIAAYALLIIISLILILTVSLGIYFGVKWIFSSPETPTVVNPKVTKRQDEIDAKGQMEIDSTKDGVLIQNEQSDARIQQAENQTQNGVQDYTGKTNSELGSDLERKAKQK